MSSFAFTIALRLYPIYTGLSRATGVLRDGVLRLTGRQERDRPRARKSMRIISQGADDIVETMSGELDKLGQGKPGEHRASPHMPLYATFMDYCRPVPAKLMSLLNQSGLDWYAIDKFGLRYYFHGYRSVLNRMIEQYGEAAMIDSGLLLEKIDRQGKRELVGLFDPYRKAGVPYLVVPYLRGGKPISIKARALVDSNHLRSKNIPPALCTHVSPPAWFNVDCLATADPVVILQRELDTVAAAVAEVNAVAYGSLANLRLNWIQQLTGKRVLMTWEESRRNDPRVDQLLKLFRSAGVANPEILLIPDGASGVRLIKFLTESLSVIRLGDSIDNLTMDGADLASSIAGFDDLLETDPLEGTIAGSISDLTLPQDDRRQG